MTPFINPSHGFNVIREHLYQHGEAVETVHEGLIAPHGDVSDADSGSRLWRPRTSHRRLYRRRYGASNCVPLAIGMSDPDFWSRSKFTLSTVSRAFRRNEITYCMSRLVRAIIF